MSTWRWLRYWIELPEDHRVLRRPDPQSPAWRHTLRAIEYMDNVARRHAAVLVLAPITPFNPATGLLLRDECRRRGIPIVDTSSLTMTQSILWLERDGHFSPVGARRMARLMADHLRQH